MKRKKAWMTLVLTLLMVTLMVADLAASITWSDEVQITNDFDFDGYPSIAQMNDGRIWIVWKSRRITNHETRNSNIFCKIYNRTWSNDTALVTDLSEDIGPSITQAQDGKIWLVWASNRLGNYSIYYKTSPSNGLWWTSETRLTADSDGDYHPSILQASDGKIWVVWQRNLSGNHEIFYKVFNGSSWSNETRLTTDPNFDMNPSITQMHDSRIWVSWCSDRIGGGENYEIFYKVFNGSSWSIDFQLTDSPDIDAEPTIFQTLNGTIWVIWTSRKPTPTATNDLYYRTSSDNGITWSGIIQLTTDANDDTWPSAIQIHDRSIWIVWASDRIENWEIYFKCSPAGDVNNDGIVDVVDIVLVVHALWTTNATGGVPGEWWAWNPDSDLDANGIVDAYDLYIVTINYLEYA